jgi:3-methyl-2-oxobutanoate hydroxymethyltransferase
VATEKRVTVPAVRAMKSQQRIGMLTAYDYPSAKIADAAGADILLVGDSLGMVVLGYPDTLSVTVEDMLHHTRAVVRGTQRALVVGDMPYLSYHVSISESVRNAGSFVQAGAQAVKVEGGKRSRIRTIAAILDAEIPVMGHIGLTPQSVNAFGGYRVQGRGDEAAHRLLQDAKALQHAGAFAVVLEVVPSEVAAQVTRALHVPTIGIGAGPSCDAQVLVWQDMAGLRSGKPAKFVKEFAQVGDVLRDAAHRFGDEVRGGTYPSAEHEYH